MDVWLAHYDHVGNGGPQSFNIKKRNNQAYRIDFGGVFEWKASGKRKGAYHKDIKFTDNAVQEWKQYQIQGHPFFTPTHFIFADMTIDEKIASLEVVANIKVSEIEAAVADVFPETLPCLNEDGTPNHDLDEDGTPCSQKKLLTDLLKKRQQSLIAILMVEQIYRSDLDSFCKIDAIQLHDGTEGKKKQRQMWDQLKEHGYRKWFKKAGKPEALTTTLDRHSISKTGTLALKLQETIQQSNDKKKSILE